MRHKIKSISNRSCHTHHQIAPLIQDLLNGIESSDWLTFLLHSYSSDCAALWIVHCLFKQGDCTNRGKQPSSPGLSSPSESQTAETNQIISITMLHLGQKNTIPELTILTQTKVSHTVRSFTCDLSSHARQNLLQYECRRVREGNISFKHAHTLTRREAPHMGFSSKAVASWTFVQWALPLIVVAKHSLYHVHYFCKGCADHFPNVIRCRHLPLAPQPLKVSHLRYIWELSHVSSVHWVVRSSTLSLIICRNRFSVLLWIFYTFKVAETRSLSERIILEKQL